jgi:predicted N-formylglutamate amidohydrolase
MTMDPATPGAPARLLGPDDPDPVGEINADSTSPFFLLCDHAGNAVPAALHGLGLPQTELDRHIGIDIGVLGVAKGLAERLGAPLVWQRYSRLVIDCNRLTSVPTSMAAVADGTVVPGNQNLDEAARAARIREIMAPYHERITRRLDDRLASRLPTILVAVHSFTPRLLAAPADRPWVIGLCWGKQDQFSRHVLCALREDDSGLMVGENQPYDVDMVNDYSIPIHGEGRKLPYAEIEIRQDQITDARGQEFWAARMARVLDQAAETFTASRPVEAPAYSP